MKLFKKCLYSVLFVTALLTSIQTTAHASTTQYTFSRWESGTIVINNLDGREIYDINGKPLSIYYGPGESFTYDSVWTDPNPYPSSTTINFSAHYISHSGEDRFFPTSYIDKTTGRKIVFSDITIY